MYMVAAGFIFALSNTLVQYATMVQGAPSTGVAFWQYLIAAALFAPWLWGQRGNLLAGLTGGQALRVALGAVGVQFWVAGLAAVPIWQAIALIMTSPLFVTLGAALFLGETVGLRRWAAVVIGAVGGAIILAPWSDAFSWAAVYPVIAAAFWAGASLMTKHLSHTQSAESLTAWLLVLLVPINAAVGLGGGFDVPSQAGWMAVIAAGVAIALAQYLLARAYLRADAAFLQPFDHVKLIFNVGLGILAFGFAPPGRLWLGAALIIGALVLLERDDR